MDISSLRERDNIGAFSVSELNNYIKNLFDSNRTLAAVTVKGEISNFTNHRSGHLYFSLKDAEGQIRAVMFRSRAMSLKFMPESGMKVIVHGSVSVFPRDGAFQIYVNSMQPDGIGALYLAYEQLKEKLYSEGLFDPEHKKAIPEFPERIGVITSPTGAAVRDIINVSNRRYPLASIYLYPALVQGDGAVDSLIKALDYFESSGLCDTIIIGRGGGSIEDLWAFNSEKLARRIYEAKTPIISAVGHETDFTIADFVSDLRAPTPSAAAELAVPDLRELLMRVDNLLERGTSALGRRSERAREKLDRLKGALTSEKMLSYLDLKREKADGLAENATAAMKKTLDGLRARLAVGAGKLESLSPLSVLKRGYSIIEKNGATVKTVDSLRVGEKIDLRLTDGVATAEVTRITEK